MKKPSRLDIAMRHEFLKKYEGRTIYRTHRTYAPAPETTPALAPDKGKYGGSCNVTRCQMPESAVYYNRATQKYYCGRCAHDINRSNRKESMELYGEPDLCVLHDDSTLLSERLTQSKVIA